MVDYVRLGKPTTILFRAAAFIFAGSAVFCALGEGLTRTYANGYTITLKIGESLYESLPTRWGDQLDPRPVSVQSQERPFIDPVALTDDSKVSREVSLSVGLIDLMNHVSHAKAVDRITPGFFDSYVKTISLGSHDHLNLPEISEPRYWSDTVKNDQMSYFNQMVSVLMAINLSHHYLGHYAKYAEKMGASETPLPINQFLTPVEWEMSVKAGAINSCSCALATAGARALFEAIDKLPQRPSWTAYIAPPFANLQALNKELDDYEFQFYHGTLGDQNTR
ncbi:MAG TPA: hypothetical protein VHB20_08195 [Verrucomicrobiae bacterium]|nr:hypothetical protein [Verrucomicrobiae bacterium]